MKKMIMSDIPGENSSEGGASDSEKEPQVRG